MKSTIGLEKKSKNNSYIRSEFWPFTYELNCASVCVCCKKLERENHKKQWILNEIFFVQSTEDSVKGKQ